MIPSPERTTKFFGPPGTGKSTTLLNVVDQLLTEGATPESILFTTFSRAGAYEARNRACLRFKLPEKSFPYFCTLHSLCLSSLAQPQVIDAGDWCVIAKTLGLRFGIKFNGLRNGSLVVDQEGLAVAGTRGDALIALWALARTTRRSFQQVLDDCAPTSRFPDITIQELEHFAESVKAYKREHGKIDYTDMLEHYLVEGTPINARYAIIDEAQDLSNLQWAVLHKICEPAERIWVAGDDDQCIHAWNGASVQGLIDLPAKSSIVLSQSHRVPGTVHELAQKIIGQVKNRIAKDYRPTELAGTVRRIDSLDKTLEMDKGTWLLLARNQIFLNQYAEACHQRGLLYDGIKAYNPQSIRAIEAWKALVEGKVVSMADARLMYSMMHTRDRVKWGAKSKLEAAEDHSLNYDDLVKDFGLLATKEMPWQKALDAMPLVERVYLSTVEQKSGLENCRVTISTIHGAKGKEADNVVICPNMTQRTFDSYFINPEEEHRVWYVGVTRARQNLYLLNPTTDLCYPL